ncbi:MAG: urease subunit beta [Deltaproteobacteria bacterium]|jgi:urease subunit beta|nr:urease subunit beta [Deltaproteobacteria bacterium]
MIPGEYFPLDSDIELNAGKDTVELEVSNTADRPIQVGSHFHFFEANAGLAFDRGAAWGRRLDIIPGASVRFEPGRSRKVALVPFGGRRRAVGFRGLAMGPLDGPGSPARRAGPGPGEGGAK